MSYREQAALATIGAWHRHGAPEAPEPVAWQRLYRANLFQAMSRLGKEARGRLYRLFQGLDRHVDTLSASTLPLAQSCAELSLSCDLSPAMAYSHGEEAILHVAGEIAYGFPVDGYLGQIEKASKVQVFINSPGGNSHDGLRLAEALRQRDSIGTAHGVCCSAAMTILQGCRHRQVASDARLMVHAAIQFAGGDAAHLRGVANALEAHQARTEALYDRVDPALVRLWFKAGDHYLTGEEALACKLCDEIIPPPVAPPDPSLPVLPIGDIPDAEVSRLAHALLGRLRDEFEDPASFQAVLGQFLQEREENPQSHAFGGNAVCRGTALQQAPACI